MQLDWEVLELLRHEPELLAVADAIAATLVLDTASSAVIPSELGQVPDDEAEVGEASWAIRCGSYMVFTFLR